MLEKVRENQTARVFNILNTVTEDPHTGHTFQRLKSLFWSVIVICFYSLRLKKLQHADTDTSHIWEAQTHVGSVGGRSRCEICPRVQTCRITAGGGVNLAISSPSFFCVSSLSTNRLAYGFSARTFSLPHIQRALTVGDWRAMKNRLSSCFFLIAFRVNLSLDSFTRQQNSCFISCLLE